jgi:hypothetical protein
LQPNRNALPVATDPMGNATGAPSDNQLPSDSVIQQFVDSMSQKIGTKLLGLGGEERYQLWPERVIREGISAPHDVMTEGMIKPGLRREDFTDASRPSVGDVPAEPGLLSGFGINKLIAPVAADPSDKAVSQAMSMSALAGSGGIAGAGEEAGAATLGSAPFLRPALKYEGKIYKGPVGGEHYDAIPPTLHKTFQQQAMSGEDLSNFNFGFTNHKGHFLSREDALKYAIDEGLIHPNSEAARAGTLTSTMQLMADSSKPGTAIEALKPAAPFYSAAEKAIEAIPQTKMTGEQWLGTLANKPGVKPEELDWTGLKNFLSEKGKEPVTKEQVQAHMNDNSMKLNEVNKGELSDKDILDQSKIRQEDWDKMSQSQREVIRAGFPIDKTKYSDYQLPGGENYREKLLTLPPTTKKIPFDEWYKQTNIQDFDKLSPKAQELVKAKYEKEGQNVVNTANYKSSHWDEPNILAHVRMNDRTIEGKKSLHLEEIQSDWHQQGREKGYRQPELPVRNFKTYLAEEKGITDPKEVKRLWEDRSTPEGIALHNAHLAETETRAMNVSKVPDAPFKKSWHELALKRALYEAATNGYDRLSWTPGEAQAARYDLSKSVEKIHYNKKENMIAAYDKNGRSVINQKATPNELPDIIGKEASKKLLEEGKPITSDSVELSGQDLKIGGEGMKGFYDKIIPQALEKLGKEHGVKVKTEKIPLPSRENFNQRDANGRPVREFPNQEVHYIDIPQSLKDQAIKKGFPLFSTGLPIPNESKQ